MEITGCNYPPNLDVFPCYANNVKFLWSRIQTGRPWVQWVDTIQNRISDTSGLVSETMTHLVRYLSDSAYSIDTVYGRILPQDPGLSVDSSIHVRATLSLGFPDSGSSFYFDTLNAKAEERTSGSYRNSKVDAASSLVARTAVTWTSSDTSFVPDSPPAWTNTAASISWTRIYAVWTYRIAGITDSVVSEGMVPTRKTTGIRPHTSALVRTSLHATDLAGRPVPLGQALPLGPHLATVEGRLQTVIVRP